MRVITSSELQQKVTALDSVSLSILGGLLAAFEKMSKESILENYKAKVLKLSEDIYVIRAHDLRVFFFIGTDEHGEYLMLLDITEQSNRPREGHFFATKNPRTNKQFNPRFNSQLNPRHNSSINPRHNSAINPRHNSSINPRHNSAINPRYNSAINPRYNSAINPRHNSAFGGPFFYSLDAEVQGYLIKASDQVSLLFNMDTELSEIVVSCNEQVSVIFNTDNEWVGYLVFAQPDFMLRFDDSSNWIGFIV